MDELTELKESIRNLFFVEKIFYLLSFTDRNPEKINSVGIYWVDVEGTMATNSTILGNCIGIKANSVNKNFVAAGINKVKVMNSGHLFSRLINNGKWSFRRARDFEFKPNTAIEELKQIRPKNHKTSLSSPLPVIRKPFILDNGILALSKFKSKPVGWIESFKKQFLKHWYKVLNSAGTENPYISISHVANYISKSHDITYHTKLVALLKFFADNSNVIDINGYCIFCSFFGIRNRNLSNDIINEFPLKVDENAATNWTNWLELNKSSPTLEKYLFDQPSLTWTLCFSNEPGKFILLRKIENCITQTFIYFDCLNNLFFTNGNNRSIQTFVSLNDIIKDRLQLSLLNLMKVESASQLVYTTIDIFHKTEPIVDDLPFFDDL